MLLSVDVGKYLGLSNRVVADVAFVVQTSFVAVASLVSEDSLDAVTGRFLNAAQLLAVDSDCLSAISKVPVVTNHLTEVLLGLMQL